MSNLVDKTPLTAAELAFQCLALTHAALFSDEPAIKESLLFVLLDRVDALHEMLPEKCPTCSDLPAVGDRYVQNDDGMTAIVRRCAGKRVVFSYEPYPAASHDYSLEAFMREFTRQGGRHA
ncbi:MULTISPECIES: hypothetical protein [unclassified Serratia (in: enterobacteria)]|uniref:hypothetical protein n=1 Tax=unclassified Serratia (in: enterobacteria) TaxID=2647522 RepID=UPI0030763D8D